MLRSGCAIALALTMFSLPALAQELTKASDQVSEIPPASPTGVRQTQTSDFTLIEYGLWHGAEQKEEQLQPVPLRLVTRGEMRSREPRLAKEAKPSFRRSAWLPSVYAAEHRHGLPIGLLDALIWTESHYNPMALSGAGAAGLAQLMPGTAQNLGVANRYDPIASIDGGARYLRQMLDRFGAIHLALAAYNAGPGAVEKAQGIPANGETPSYVRSVLARWGLM
ncbi:MAG: lytic transglycosylase domain-containing protein [Novosphingobium sp.]